MKFPSYSVNGLDTNEKLKNIARCLKPLGISIPLILEDASELTVDGVSHRVKPYFPNKEIPCISYEEFMAKYIGFWDGLESWINNLKRGDQVVIDHRFGDQYDYPYSFTDEMTRYSGKTMTISCVSNLSFLPCKFGFGSDKVFYFEEDYGGFSWHASMFANPFDSYIPTRINLQDLVIDPIKLL